MSLPVYHTPVLLHEVIRELNIQKKGRYIDATAGGGGYIDEIMRRGGVVLGIDRDWDAINTLKTKYQSQDTCWIRQGNFRHIQKITKGIGWKSVNGVLFDLGMSSHQIEASNRGFSYKGNEPLDMRMDIQNNTTAAQILNVSSKEELNEIFVNYAEELNSRSISEAIVRARTIKRIETVHQLASIVEHEIANLNPGVELRIADRLKKETLARIFQALRIEVNDELTNLRVGLKDAIDLLTGNGRVVVLSYHSLEDRIVKQIFLEFQKSGLIQFVTKQPIRPTYLEIKSNSKARCAKMRVAEKI